MASITKAITRGRTIDQGAFVLSIRKFARNKLAVFGAVALVTLTLLAILAPIVAPASPIKMDLENTLLPPSRSHIFGTDSFGRDVFSRIIYGARVSLTVGFLSATFAVILGVPIGLGAGYLGGTVDNVLMRIMDALLSVPPILLAIALIGFLGPEVRNLILVLGLVYTPTMARLVRGSSLAVKEEVYVTAARSTGANQLRIISRHILPNVISPIIVQATVIFSWGIIAEAALSFLGLGTQPPTPSWGQDLNDGRRYIGEANWLVVAPAMAIIVSALSINFIGDGLRELLDPQFRRS